jgi:hypothetical protein
MPVGFSFATPGPDRGRHSGRAGLSRIRLRKVLEENRPWLRPTGRKLGEEHKERAESRSKSRHVMIKLRSVVWL